jgi:tryptophan synthase alpha chain
MFRIPVAAPSMKAQRLAKLASSGCEYIYAPLRAGITGSETVIDAATLEFIKNAGAGGAKILGGFGITSREQVQAVSPYVYAVVAGSVFVRIISDNYEPFNEESRLKIVSELKKKAAELAGVF